MLSSKKFHMSNKRWMLLLSIVGLCACSYYGISSFLATFDNTIDRGECSTALKQTNDVASPPTGTVINLNTTVTLYQLPLITSANAAKIVELERFGNGYSLSRPPKIALSPDGKIALLVKEGASSNGVVRLCDVATGKQIHGISSDETVNRALYSPDGKILAINEGRGQITLLDATSFSEIATFDVRNGKQWANTNLLAFSPDSKILAFAMDDYQSGDYSIRLWDIKNHSQLASLQGHTSELLDLIFNTQGTLLVSANGDGTIRLWGMPVELL